MIEASKKRSYHEKAVTDGGWSMAGTVRCPSGASDRDLWLSWGLDKLNCPFTRVIDYDSTAKRVDGSYKFYFGMEYSRTIPEVDAGTNRMNKVDKHIWADSKEFDLLAADFEKDSVGVMRANHPDRDKILLPPPSDDFENAYWKDKANEGIRGGPRYELHQGGPVLVSDQHRPHARPQAVQAALQV